jgi:ubiquitin-like 1-activating enzyme E1 A
MAADSTTATSSDGTNGAIPPPTSNGTSTTTGDNMTTTTGQSLSADEIALYDRQIRLWGAQAQERIRSAHILLVSLRALGTEIAKNLVLAGISSLTIIDDDLVAEEDLGAQYFLREEDVGKPVCCAHLPLTQLKRDVLNSFAARSVRYSTNPRAQSTSHRQSRRQSE